jgi:hypothetical protein
MMSEKPKIVQIDGKKAIILEEGISLQDYKDAIIENTLDENGQHVIKSAEKLKICKNTIYRNRNGRQILKG